MKSLFFFCILLVSFVIGFAQEVQWADELLRYSSQYGPKGYSAKQVLGKPNKLPDYGPSPVAWAPAREDNRVDDYVRVKYRTAQHVQQIAIAENLNPGAVYKIYLYDTKGRQHKVYENTDMIVPLTPGGRMFHIFIPRTEYLVNELKLVLRTSAIPGMNQIDAIGIADSKIPVEASIHTVELIHYEGEAENLGSGVNSIYDEMLPIISPDGQTLYFARKLHPQNFGEAKADDIWYAEMRPDSTWGPAKHLGEPLNNEYHNYVAAVSPDGNTLVLANEYTRLGVPAQGVSISQKKNGIWSKPRNLRIKGFYNLNDFSCYHMGVDGDILLMAIERHDSYGDMDLYVSFKEEGLNWSEPLNLGPQINTAGTEGSVFLAADNKTIYFSSDGYSGYGSFDMYMSRRLDDTWTHWTEPVNLGPKINSRWRDFYYTIPASGDYAYFSSDKGSFGKSDLYRIKLPRELRPLPVTLVETKVVDALTREPLEIDVHFRGTLGNRPFERDVQLENGETKFIIPKEAELIAEIDIPGYFPIRKNLSPVDKDELQFLDYAEDDIATELELELRLQMRDSLKHFIELELEKKSPEQIRNEQGISNHSPDSLIAAVLAGKPSAGANRDSLKNVLEPVVEQALIDELLDDIEKKDEYVEMSEDIEAIPIREGQIIRMDNIYFDANKWYLRPESHEELDRVVQFLKDNPNVFVEVGGHTNGLPSTDFCNTLSENRAKRVARYLIEHGIEPERVTWKGYGKTRPIADNSTLAGRKKNQRVELKITKVE